MKQFTIDRKKWYRGKGFWQSALLTESSERCAIGFYLSACGLPDEALRGRKRPTNIRAHFLENVDGFGWLMDASQKDASITDQIMWVNDAMKLTEYGREKQLKKLFSKKDIVVKFEG